MAGLIVAQKTFWHLQGAQRLPSPYEVVSSRLLWYPGRPFEVETPLQAWYDAHQAGSPLRMADWEQFKDPRETTYSRYAALQSRQETVVEAHFRSIEASGHDTALTESWRGVISRVVTVLRYPWHGLQMIAAYVGQMAPSGRIVIAAAFQAADEVRRIHTVAYRTAQLAEAWPGFGEGAKRTWQEDPLWQPLRRTVEQLLVTWDFGEALVALNVCLKPALDELFLTHLGEVARLAGDYPLREIFQSLRADALWQRDWTRALLEVAFAAEPGNRAVVQAWVDRWLPRACEAAEPFASLLAPSAMASLAASMRAELDTLGLDWPGGLDERAA